MIYEYDSNQIVWIEPIFTKGLSILDYNFSQSLNDSSFEVAGVT